MERFVCILLAIIIGTLGSLSSTQAKRTGAKIGIVSPEGTIGSTFGIGGISELGMITPNFRIEEGIELWHKGHSIYNWGYTNIGIDTTLKYDITLSNSQMVPFMGAGLGIHILRWGYYGGYDEDDFITKSRISTDLAIHIVGGTEYKLSGGSTGFVEAKISTGGWDYIGLFIGMKF